MTLTVIKTATLQANAVHFYFPGQNPSDILKTSLGYQVKYIERECNIKLQYIYIIFIFFHYYDCYSHNGCYTRSWCTFWFSLTISIWKTRNKSRLSGWIYWMRMQYHWSFVYIICSSFLLLWLLQSQLLLHNKLMLCIFIFLDKTHLKIWK